MDNIDAIALVYLKFNALILLSFGLWIATLCIGKYFGIQLRATSTLGNARVVLLVVIVSPLLVASLSIKSPIDKLIGGFSLENPQVQESFEDQETTVDDSSVVARINSTNTIYLETPASFTTQTEVIAEQELTTNPLSMIGRTSTSTVDDRLENQSANSTMFVPWTVDNLNLIYRVLLICFVMGFSWRLTRLVREVLNLTRLISNSVSLKCAGTLRILLTDQINTPMAVSFLDRSYIVIPSALTLSNAQLSLILKHEGEHLRHGDLRWNFLMELLTLFCFWNPASYAWKIELHNLQEFACDERVLAKSGISKFDYSQCLLQVAEFVTRQYSFSASMSLKSWRLKNREPLLRKRINYLDYQQSLKTGSRKMPILMGLSIFFASMVAFGSNTTVITSDEGVAQPVVIEIRDREDPEPSATDPQTDSSRESTIQNQMAAASLAEEADQIEILPDEPNKNEPNSITLESQEIAAFQTPHDVLSENSNNAVSGALAKPEQDLESKESPVNSEIPQETTQENFSLSTIENDRVFEDLVSFEERPEAELAVTNQNGNFVAFQDNTETSDLGPLRTSSPSSRLAQQSSEASGNSSQSVVTIEEIVVTAEQTLYFLRTRLRYAEVDMYSSYNQYNDEEDFEMDCSKAKNWYRDSRLRKRRICWPNFFIEIVQEDQKRAISDSAIDHGTGLGIAAWAFPPTSVSTLYSQQRNRFHEFRNHMLQVANENQEVTEAILDFARLEQAYILKRAECLKGPTFLFIFHKCPDEISL